MDWMDVFFKIKSVEGICTYVVAVIILVGFILFYMYVHLGNIIDDIKNRKKRRQ